MPALPDSFTGSRECRFPPWAPAQFLGPPENNFFDQWQSRLPIKRPGPIFPITLYAISLFALAEIHGEFSKVLHVSLENVFECIQVVSPTKLWIAFKDKNSLEETASVGLEFRGLPITLTPLHSKTWLSVSHVQFGVPSDSVKAALAPYGPIDRLVVKH